MIKKLWSAVKSILEPLGKLISGIVNSILLSIVYFVGVGIVSISMKLFGKHFLELKKKMLNQTGMSIKLKNSIWKAITGLFENEHFRHFLLLS